LSLFGNAALTAGGGTGGPATVIERAVVAVDIGPVGVVGPFVIVGVPPAVTRTAKADVPMAAGVPATVPVVGSRVRPVGRAPLVTAHTYGDEPPSDWSVAKYGWPTVAAGSAVVVIPTWKASRAAVRTEATGVPIPVAMS
jgi:hypothetical protein